MNKSEKKYFVERMFMNFINEDSKIQYRMNMQIVLMFKHLNYIPTDLYNKIAQLVHKAAFEDSFYAISKTQELLCKEFNIPIRD